MLAAPCYTCVMKYRVSLSFLAAAGLLWICPVRGQELVHAKNGSGVYGYKDTPVLPWCGYHVHDPDRPEPKRVEPGPPAPPAAIPSDAVILFDGKDLSKWENG